MSIIEPSANSGGQKPSRLENFAQPHCFWRGSGESCRAINVRTPQNGSGTKTADITSGIPFTSARVMHVVI